jgi:predicted Rossmann fold flavoprotein
MTMNDTIRLMAKNIEWDVIVVGGGPAGMMAAGTAAKNGARVVLLEKNDSLGKKLLITGGGRCNVTNSEFDDRKLLAKFKDNGKFLFSAFSQWSVGETLDFFHVNGMQTKVENELRTFPVSNSAQSVWDVLVAQIKKYKVKVLSNTAVVEIVCEDAKLVGVKLKDKTIILGRTIIIATGGISRPETGSTGDGYVWLKKIGHTVIDPTPSLVPIALKDVWIKKLAGIKLDGVKITALQNNEKQVVAKGKLLFTHVGISGPTVLNMSKDIGELLKYGPVTILVDVFPTDDAGLFDKKLQELFAKNDKKKIRNAITAIIPTALASVLIELTGVDAETPCNSITKEQRRALVTMIKNMPLTVDKLLGVEKAVITSGGVALDEVDFKTMQSRLYPNLYLIGDILNIDRPSGGYSLQLCWTTGFVAGKSAGLSKVDNKA